MFKGHREVNEMSLCLNYDGSWVLGRVPHHFEFGGRNKLTVSK